MRYGETTWASVAVCTGGAKVRIRDCQYNVLGINNA